MNVKAEVRAQSVRASYKKYSDRRIRHFPQFEIRDWVFVGRPPNFSASTFSEQSRKPRTKTAGSLQVRRMRSHSKVVEDGGSLNTISDDGRTTARRHGHDADPKRAAAPNDLQERRNPCRTKGDAQCDYFMVGNSYEMLEWATIEVMFSDSTVTVQK